MVTRKLTEHFSSALKFSFLFFNRLLIQASNSSMGFPSTNPDIISVADTPDLIEHQHHQAFCVIYFFHLPAFQ